MPQTTPPVETAGPGDWDEIATLFRTAFHDALDEESLASERQVYEPDRSLVIRDEGRIVAHAAALTRDLTVPGGMVPAAHVTMVAVAQTHRRQGLLTRLMRHQLEQVRDVAREPLAALWASESQIYPRFGYGLAAHRLRLDIAADRVRLPAGRSGGTAADPTDGTGAGRGSWRLRQGRPTDLVDELARVYDRVRPHRPGWSSRDGRWWRHLLSDVASRRSGATERQALLYHGPDGVDGYALWRTRPDWDARGPQGRVLVGEVVAATPAAYLELWRFLLSMDLTRTAEFGFGTLDEPLQHLVDDPRQLGAALSDSLWVRIVDVPAALAARRYAADLDLVFEIIDPLLATNSGRWRLTASGGTARCGPATEPADLACGIVELGAAYLGGSSLSGLAAAGRVRELTPGALARATAAFGWHRAPGSPEVF